MDSTALVNFSKRRTFLKAQHVGSVGCRCILPVNPSTRIGYKAVGHRNVSFDVYSCRMRADLAWALIL
jgi:hypothetical protein